MNKADYPVFPDADAGADPSVPAEQGGKGFTGKGWETNTDFDLIGDPHAVKGGVFRDYILDFPGTLRMAGPECQHRTSTAKSTALVYETLLGLHPTTCEYMPGARHALADFAGQDDVSLPHQSQRALFRRHAGHQR